MGAFFLSFCVFGVMLTIVGLVYLLSIPCHDDTH